MDLEDIPVPPPPSSSTGDSSAQDEGNGGTAASEAWRKAQEALQRVGGGSGKQSQDAMAGLAAAYNPYMAYAYSTYSSNPGSVNSYPSWMQSAYSAWSQQQQQQATAAAGSYQRFGFNSAPTQSKTSLPSSNSPSSATDQSSSESTPSSSNFRSSYRPQMTPHRALLGDRPPGRARPGLGYAARPAGSGGIRFEFGRQRGGLAQNRFSSNAGAGLGVSEMNGGDDAENRNAAKPNGMPETMKQYIERAYAAAETTEQKNQVEQALKQRLTPLLHSGEAWQMDWDKEPLPTDTDFAVRLLKANLLARGRGGFQGGARGRGARGGFGGGLLPNLQAQISSAAGFATSDQHQQGNFDPVIQRGRGAFTLRGRGRGSFGVRQPLLHRPRLDSGSSNNGNEDNNNNKDRSHVNGDRIRRRSSSASEDGPRKRRRGSSNGHRTSESSHDSYDGSYGKKSGSKKKKWTPKKKKNKKLQKKHYSPEDVDNDDRDSDDSFSKGKKPKKKAMKFTLDKHQSTAEQEAMKQHRAMRFAKHMNPKTPVAAPSKPLSSRLGRRLGGYNNNSDSFLDDRSGSSDSNYMDVDFDPTAFLIVGTCQALEKQYFRLTTVPDPSQVRPQSVLEQAVAMVKRKWKEKGDYRYVCDQFKSIRQDMTIQCIRNHFSVQVYETHARIALEKGDREEFNQCQSQLKALYAELPGCPNEYEFTAYRLLFYVYMEDTMDITTILAHLTPEMFRDECIGFALKIRRACSLRNYHAFFKLSRHGRPPRMCMYVLDLFMERERKRALKTLLTGFRPTLPVNYITNELSFEAEDDCIEFLKKLQIPFVEDDESKVDCRQQIPAF